MPAVNPGPSSIISTNPQGLLNNNGIQLLFMLRGANLQLTSDQQFAKMFNGLTWDPYFIVANWISGAYSTSCLGGIFTGAGKTGSAIVSTGQSYSGLTGAFTHTNCTIQASTTTFTAIPYLSLSTGNTGGLIADFFIYGACYD